MFSNMYAFVELLDNMATFLCVNSRRVLYKNNLKIRFHDNIFNEVRGQNSFRPLPCRDNYIHCRARDNDRSSNDFRSIMLRDRSNLYTCGKNVWLKARRSCL